MPVDVEILAEKVERLTNVIDAHHELISKQLHQSLILAQAVGILLARLEYVDKSAKPVCELFAEGFSNLTSGKIERSEALEKAGFPPIMDASPEQKKAAEFCAEIRTVLLQIADEVRQYDRKARPGQSE